MSRTGPLSSNSDSNSIPWVVILRFWQTLPFRVKVCHQTATHTPKLFP